MYLYSRYKGCFEQLQNLLNEHKLSIILHFARARIQIMQDFDKKSVNKRALINL